MTEQQSPSKALAVTNYDKIKALAQNENTIRRFAEMLGSRREAQSYISSALLAVANSKELMECTPSSVFNAVMRAAALHLYCDPALRQAHPVPYFNSKTQKREASLIIGYIGLNNLALRTGKYRILNTGCLYEGQSMEVNQLTGEAQITGLRKSDKVVGYFHYFELLNGLSHTFYMSVEELKAHGEQYAPKNPLWRNKFPDMCKKTVTRLNLLKTGILDPADRAMLNELDETRPEGELITSDDNIDTSFTEIDDAQAEKDAEEVAEKKAAEPKRDPQEIVSELYGDNGQPVASADNLNERPWTDAKVTLEMAKAELSSDKRHYWDMPTEQLTARFNSLEKSLKENHLEPKERDEKMIKRDVVKAIIDYRAPKPMF